MKALLSRGIPSDQMTIFYALAEFEAMLKQNKNSHQIQQFLDRNFLSRSTMTFLLDLEKQLHRSLESTTGISLKHNFTTRYERSERKCIPLLLSLVGIGLYSTVAVSNGGSNFTTEKGCKARIHPSSVNRRQGDSNQAKTLEMIAYQELVAAPPSSVPGAANLLMISTCPVSLYAYLLSCGSIEIIPEEPASDDDEPSSQVQESNGSIHILVDGWLSLSVSPQTIEIVEMSRSGLDHALDYFLENPKHDLPTNLLCQVTAITDALVFESTFNEHLNSDKKSSNSSNDSTKSNKLSSEGKKLAKNPKK